MSFIADDEFILLMDDPARLNLDDLKRIRETGVRTIYAYIHWAAVQPAPGSYNWEPVVAQIERARAADMKVLLRCYEHAPSWFPPDWYLQTATGTRWRNLPGWGEKVLYSLLSPWCADAMAAEEQFLWLCLEMFASPTVQLYAGVTHSGELLLPGMVASYYDPHAIASFREHVGRADAMPADLPTYDALKQEEETADWLIESLLQCELRRRSWFPEIWLSLVERGKRPVEDFGGPRSGNWMRRGLCTALPQKLNKPLDVLLFEVYRPEGLEGALDSLAGYEDRIWVGSQFCEGLYAHTPDAIARGLRGFITAPVHDMRAGGFEPWMLEAFNWSQVRWRQAAGVAPCLAT